ncbi:MAG: DUF3413 domain-containing protein [Succinivibrio sp.]
MNFKLNNPLMKEQVLRSSTWGHHFIFLNSLLAIFIGFAYVYAAPNTESFISFIYLIATWFGQISFLVFLTFLILFFPLTFIGNFRAYRIISVILAVLLHCLLLVDAKLFISVKVHLTWMVTSLILRDLDFKTGLNFNFMYIALIILIVLEIIFARLATREIYKRTVRHNYFPAVVMSFVSVCFIASHAFFIWADATGYEKITNLRTVFPAHYPMTAKSFLSNHGWIDTESGEVVSSTSSINYPLSEIDAVAHDRPSNIILIMINGMSYADLSQKNTPNLLSLKLTNTSFEQHFLAYQKLDDNYFASAFGVPIQYKESFLNHNIIPVLVKELQKQEYAVRVFNSGVMAADTRSLNSLFGISDNKIKTFSDDAEAFDQAYEFIRSRNENQHYQITLNSNTLFGNLSKKAHDQKLRELDELTGCLITKLTEEGRLSNTLVMISSLAGNPLLGRHDTVYSKHQQHVPMIAIWPENSLKGATFNTLSSNFDMAPTIGTEILGVKTPSGNYSIGNSLLKNVGRDYILSTSGYSLLLISKDDVTVYRKNGLAHTDNEGVIKNIRPNLETLIRAMRDLNRFKG